VERKSVKTDADDLARTPWAVLDDRALHPE